MIVKKEKGETLNYLEDASNLKADNIESVFIPQNEEEVGEIVKHTFNCICRRHGSSRRPGAFRWWGDLIYGEVE